MSRTFCLLKPDAVKQNFVGDILCILGNHFRIVNLKMAVPTREQVEDHYREHVGRSYFDAVVEFMCSGPVVAIVLEHLAREVEAVSALRDLMGPFKQEERRRGTIRHRLMDARNPGYMNLIHGADSDMAAEREARIWFDYPHGTSFLGDQFPMALVAA